MAPTCASFGFRSKVQSTEGTRVKPVLWWSYSRDVLWKNKFTFAAKSSSWARWHGCEKTCWLATNILWHGSGAVAPAGTGVVLPFGHRNRSCAGPGSLCVEGWRQSLGFHRPYKNHKNDMKLKQMKMAEARCSANMPTAPSPFWAVWHFGLVRWVESSTYHSSWKPRRQQKDVEDCIVEGSFSNNCACHLCCSITEFQQPGGPCRGSSHALPLLFCLFRPFLEPYPFLTHSSQIMASLLASLSELLGTLPVTGRDIFTCPPHHIERGK